jgi:hypothetical protein
MKLDSFTESSYSDEQFNGKTRSLEDNRHTISLRFCYFVLGAGECFFCISKLRQKRLKGNKKRREKGRKPHEGSVTAETQNPREETDPSRVVQS